MKSWTPLGKRSEPHAKTKEKHHRALGAKPHSRRACSGGISTRHRYQSLRDSYYEKGQGFALVFSLISRGTFDSIVNYKAHIQRVKQTSSFPLIIIGNKSDLQAQRKVTAREGHDLAKSFNCPYIETSGLLIQTFPEKRYSLAHLAVGACASRWRKTAKTNSNVEEAFAQLARLVRDYKPSDKKGAMQDSSEYYEGGKKCCILM